MLVGIAICRGDNHAVNTEFRHPIASQVEQLCGAADAAKLHAALQDGAAWMHRFVDGFAVLTTTCDTPDTRPALYIWVAAIGGGNVLNRYEAYFVGMARDRGCAWIAFRTQRQGFARALDPRWWVRSGQREPDGSVTLEYMRAVQDGQRPQSSRRDRAAKDQRADRC